VTRSNGFGPEGGGSPAPWVSVVIPARNEAGAVGEVVTQVAATLRSHPGGGEFEIIVVDDGSTDGTGELAQKAGARVVRVEVSRGYGAALKRGIRSAASPHVCVVDADQTYSLAEVPAMLRLLDEGADQVVGVRVGHVQPLRRFVKRLITRFAGALARQPIADLNSGLRCFQRDLVRPTLGLFPDGFSFTTTLTMVGLLDGWEMRWFPVAYGARTGASKFKPVRDTLRLLACLVRAVVYFAPLRVFVPVAVGLGVPALAFAVWDVFWEHNLTDKTVLLTVSTLLALVLGLLADVAVKKR
jgi:glycosyltransferase involved in cell wall biosynthesis